MTDFQQFMSSWGWGVFSLIGAVFLAAMFLVNQYLKQPGHVLVFWSRVIVVVGLSPFVAHMTLPDDWRFYAAVTATVFLGTVADIRTFNVSAKYGGGVTSRLQPLIVWGAFFLWFLFDPQIIDTYIAHPYNTAGVLAALAGCVWFSQRLNKCDITRAALVEMLPALIGYAFTTVLNKYAMSHGTLHSAAIGYMYIQSAIAVCVLGPYVMWKERQLGSNAVFWRQKTMVLASALMALTWFAHMVFKNYAMAFTPNPSYQAALNLTAPVFIAIFYFFRNHKEEADVASGFGVVACAVLLALLTVH